MQAILTSLTPYSVDTPGTYYLAAVGGDCHIYKVEVTETVIETSGDLNVDTDENGGFFANIFKSIGNAFKNGVDKIFGGGNKDDEDSWSFSGLLKGLKGAIWGFVSGIFEAVFGGIIDAVGKGVKDFFDLFKNRDDPDGLFGIVSYGGADIWD